MSDGPRPRRAGKVVVLVLAFWIVGNLVQAALTWTLEGRGLVGVEAAARWGLVLSWGLLFLVAFVLRERLDRWLRT